MAEYLIQEETLAGLADAIRAVSNDTTMRSPEEMAAYITDYLVKPTATLEAQTITPTTSAQSIAAGTYLEGATTIGAIPSDYVKPTATKAAATITPGTSNKTIAAGTYLTGTQTIKGDSNLKAANIKSGTSIFGVSGTLQQGLSGFANFYNFTKAASGSFTIASVTSGYTVTHSLGVLPKMVILAPNGTTTISGGSTSDINVFGYFAFVTCSETEVSNSAGVASGVYMSANFYTSGWSYTSNVAGVFASESVYPNYDRYTVLASNSSDTYVYNLTSSLFKIAKKLRPSTYKWLVMA